MQYCTRCLYPANTKPVIIFDDKGVCSGCRYVEQRAKINWTDREKLLKPILEHYKEIAKKNGSIYDCIIPVSGGKDSTYQVYYLKKIHNMNPLLVTFNHTFNTSVGMRNLNNLLEKFNCDLVRFTPKLSSIKKITRFMLKEVGDVTWHYHAGIFSFPSQIAVRYKIPLVMWGEEGFSELGGMFNADDFIEFTKMKRQEHDMRGFEPHDIAMREDSQLEINELGPYIYPSDEEIESVGVRGLYLSNYIDWDAKKQTEFLINEYGFEPIQNERDRTFEKYSKIEDAANGTHDYLKYLKFGYGRATDDASTEIRRGRMTREEGIEMVKKHDHKRPSDLDFFLNYLEISEEEFENMIDNMRDTNIWSKNASGNWALLDNVENHANDEFCDKVKLPQNKERTSYLAPKKEKKETFANDFILL